MHEWLTSPHPVQHAGTPGSFVILADSSGSMARLEGDAIKAFNSARQRIPSARMFAFACHAREVHPGARRYPKTGGYTDMTLGLRTIALLRPAKTVLISDGHPDNWDTAFEAAAGLTGTIDTVWCYDQFAAEYYGRTMLLKMARGSGGNHFDLGPRDDWRTLHDIFLQSGVTVLTGEVHHHHHLPPEHRHHRAPTQQDVRSQPAQIIVGPALSRFLRIK